MTITELPPAIKEATIHQFHAGGFPVPEANSEAASIEVSSRGLQESVHRLLILSDSLDDVERARIAAGSRLGSLTRPVDKGGQALPPFDLSVMTLQRIFDELVVVEKDIIKELKREMKASPFNPVCAQNKGVGEKQLARLLGAIKDPYWNDLYDRPRTVSELWSYSGYGVKDGQAVRRVKGEKARWSTKAKSRAFVIVESCVKAGRGSSKYNDMYYRLKEANVGAVHSHDCVRCGPKGHPALAGSELSKGHRDMRAKREVAKEILQDLWLEARTHHENN